MISLTTHQQIEDFTRGCCFYATGGGGDPKFGQQMLLDALNAGKEIRIIDVNEVAPEAWTLCPYLMGTSGAETNEIKEAKKKYGLNRVSVTNMPSTAAKTLLEYAGVTLDAVVPLELGGAATASALATAAWLGVPTIDGDYSGRALPEITQSLPAIHNVSLLPLASADAYGNQTLMIQASSGAMIERIGKFIASASFGLIGQASLLAQVKQIEPVPLKRTLTKALSIGKLLREVHVKPETAIETITAATQARVLFIGSIATLQLETREGYYTGDIHIAGRGQFRNNTFKIWVKNEIILSWLNEQDYVACPDLITMIDPTTVEPIIASQLTEGRAVVVLGIAAPKMSQSTEALRVLGPQYYGFDFDSQAVDKIL